MGKRSATRQRLEALGWQVGQLTALAVHYKEHCALAATEVYEDFSGLAPVSK